MFTIDERANCPKVGEPAIFFADYNVLINNTDSEDCSALDVGLGKLKGQSSVFMTTPPKISKAHRLTLSHVNRFAQDEHFVSVDGVANLATS